MRIFWLASYPKSGNTWLRFLLYSYLHGEPAASEDVGRRIPDIHVSPPDALVETDGLPLLCKTHHMLTAKHPRIGDTAGFVYVVRHPRDVLLSALNYFRMTATHNERLTDRGYARLFIQTMGYPGWRDKGYGTWPEHVSSWIAGAAHLPHVMLRYEDLRRAPAEGLERVVRLLGLTVEPERLERAVAASTFDRMQALEAKERAEGRTGHVFTIHEESLASGRRFMREGGTRPSLDPLGEGVEAEFQARFGEVLGLLGY